MPTPKPKPQLVTPPQARTATIKSASSKSKASSKPRSSGRKSKKVPLLRGGSIDDDEEATFTKFGDSLESVNVKIIDPDFSNIVLLNETASALDVTLIEHKCEMNDVVNVVGFLQFKNYKEVSWYVTHDKDYKITLIPVQNCAEKLDVLERFITNSQEWVVNTATGQYAVKDDLEATKNALLIINGGKQ